ncbi:hypothetical protein C1E47_19195 [Vibrio cholerae]|nr:hypothetical protein [Vibrio cholerae]
MFNLSDLFDFQPRDPNQLETEVYLGMHLNLICMESDLKNEDTLNAKIERARMLIDCIDSMKANVDYKIHCVQTADYIIVRKNRLGELTFKITYY